MSNGHPGMALAGRLPLVEPPRVAPREREILTLLAEGLTDQQVAQVL
jgi:DNA-binding NarL/FixJ family response regulator